MDQTIYQLTKIFTPKVTKSTKTDIAFLGACLNTMVANHHLSSNTNAPAEKN